jgi:hypothetical protein
MAYLHSNNDRAKEEYTMKMLQPLTGEKHD